MIKCFVTGDNHFGMPYEGKLAEIRKDLIEARFISLKNMVDHANEENCDLFIITGDLFEKTDIEYIGGKDKKKGEADIKRIIDILKEFKNNVVLIPGNHDYDDGFSTVWKSFNRQSAAYDNIMVLNEFRKTSLGEINGNEVVVYPAYCQSEHSLTNNLDWIKNEDIQIDNIINIGLAHGTIEGLSCDNEGKYFYMEKKELEDIPVDVWFIGHAHIAYPKNIKEDSYTKNEKIYNAGTHQQTDIGNNTEGYGFIVEIEKNGKNASINAKKWKSGIITFHEIEVNTVGDSDDAMKKELEKQLSVILKDHDPSKTVIRVVFKGAARTDEYEKRLQIYEDLTKDFLFRYPADWYDFYEVITPEKIKQEFSEKSIVAQFMQSFVDDKTGDPKENNIELNMAYQLVMNVKNSNK